MPSINKLAKRALRFAALASVSLAALPAAAADDPVKPMYGTLQPFYGTLQPFTANLEPFYGTLQPFWGTLQPFWGTLQPFTGDLSGFWGVDDPVQIANAPQWTKVGEFWTRVGGTWSPLLSSWRAGDYKSAQSQLNYTIESSRTFWGASIQAQTGKSFDEAFASPLFAKYGLDPKKQDSFKTLDATRQALFLLDWYDGLMNYAGTDHVDHWMRTINWTPALTKTQGTGADVRVGILDQTLSAGDIKTSTVLQYSGASEFTNGHGAAVASLIVGAHDGKGVMGLAPNATVYAYNPFDATGSAGWDDVTTGVRRLKASGASVVNMSLGVPGQTLDKGWNGVFANLATTLVLKNTVFVIAAGNEGVTQKGNIPWSPLNPAFMVVGSVGLDGKISSFSNRPGDACLTLLGLCLGDELKDHFIVAPGELMLVSDGKGGVVRQSGTSIAAPLVTGAVALIHDRWPWLANFPAETTRIILESAKDLGAPGVDGVYGHGLLDVEASQSPLDFNKLVWFTVEDGRMKLQTQSAVLNTYKSEQQKTWDAKGAYFYAFEMLGLTNRDFAIPLSQKLVGQNVTTYNGAKEQFQGYLLSRMGDWAGSKTRLTFAARSFDRGAESFFGQTLPVANGWGADMSLAFAPREKRFGFRDEGPAYQTALKITGERASVTFGYGDGAAALAAQPGFNQASDYDIERGGANPLLGLASGDAYMGLAYKLTDRVQFSAGSMSREDRRDERLMPALGRRGNGAETYEAGAQHFAFAYTVSPDVMISTGYTRLHEATGLLGVQSLDPTDFQGGTTTDGFSAGFAWAAGSKLTIAASGVMGRTRAEGGNTLSVGKDGLQTSAFEVGVARSDLVAKGDVVRMTLAQPLFVERGRLNVQSVQVIDRQTGELGVVTEGVDIAGTRRLAAELFYGRPLSSRSDFAIVSRVEGDARTGRDAEYFTGATYRFSF